MSPSMKLHACWVNLLKNQIVQKKLNCKILKERITKQKTHFLPFGKKKNVKWVQIF
jgi:hypothetical protein